MENQTIVARTLKTKSLMVTVIAVLLAVTALMVTSGLASASHSVIVDIDSTKHLEVDGIVSVTLPAGAYTVTVIGTDQGGAFDAWNAWDEDADLSNGVVPSVTGCDSEGAGCITGWMTTHAILTSVDLLLNQENNGRFETPALALAAVSGGSVINVPTEQTVRFWIPDCVGCNLDNTGGVSLLIEPASLPTSKNDCKKGGWETYGIFKNQGDCVSFVATNGKNH